MEFSFAAVVACCNCFSVLEACYFLKESDVNLRHTLCIIHAIAYTVLIHPWLFLALCIMLSPPLAHLAHLMTAFFLRGNLVESLVGLRVLCLCLHNTQDIITRMATSLEFC